MGRLTSLVVGMMLTVGANEALSAQGREMTEVPVRVEAGRLVVTVERASGEALDFVLGLGDSYLTESGRERLRADLSGLTLQGIPVRLDGARVVSSLTEVDGGAPGPASVAGIVGGTTLNAYDVLVDVPGGRVLLKRPGRSVRWEGIELTNGVGVQVLHDVLIRMQVEVEGTVFAAHLDLAAPAMMLSEAASQSTGVRSGSADYRMGYAAYPELPTGVLPPPLFAGWDGAGAGFVLVGAPVAYDCTIAVSYVHAEVRTCVR